MNRFESFLVGKEPFCKKMKHPPEGLSNQSEKEEIPEPELRKTPENPAREYPRRMSAQERRH